MVEKKNLNRDTVRILRKVQKFLLEEPRRFDMHEGVTPARFSKTLEHAPCGTACCIAGSIYVLETHIPLSNTRISWQTVRDVIGKNYQQLAYNDLSRRLFYLKKEHGATQHWPEFYETAYYAAKTPLERACIGVARIEHFIQTDGRE